MVRGHLQHRVFAPINPSTNPCRCGPLISPLLSSLKWSALKSSFWHWNQQLWQQIRQQNWWERRFLCRGSFAELPSEAHNTSKGCVLFFLALQQTVRVWPSVVTHRYQLVREAPLTPAPNCSPSPGVSGLQLQIPSASAGARHQENTLGFSQP